MIDRNRRQFAFAAGGSFLLAAMSGLDELIAPETVPHASQTNAPSILLPKQGVSLTTEEISDTGIGRSRFVYDPEISHFDTHSLETEIEEVNKWVQWYHKGEPKVRQAFGAMYQVVYDFHSHMHTDFEKSPERTLVAFRKLEPVWEELVDVTRNSKTISYVANLKGFYLDLKKGIVPPSELEEKNPSPRL